MGELFCRSGLLCSRSLRKGIDIQSFQQLPLSLPRDISGVFLSIEELRNDNAFGVFGPNRGSRDRRIAGRLCAAKLLSDLGAMDLAVSKASDGSPVWPHDFVGSISHTDQVACATVAHASAGYSGLGIDAEVVLSMDIAAAISETCMRDGERKAMERSGDPIRYAAAVFSIKESFYKAVYPKVQRIVEFEEVEVVDLDFRLGSGKVMVHSPDLLAWNATPARIATLEGTTFSFVGWRDSV